MIRGTKHWLWRAVDQDGFVLDVLVQSRRDKKAAKHLLRKLLKGLMGLPTRRQAAGVLLQRQVLFDPDYGSSAAAEAEIA